MSSLSIPRNTWPTNRKWDAVIASQPSSAKRWTRFARFWASTKKWHGTRHEAHSFPASLMRALRLPTSQKWLVTAPEPSRNTTTKIPSSRNCVSGWMPVTVAGDNKLYKRQQKCRLNLRFNRHYCMIFYSWSHHPIPEFLRRTSFLSFEKTDEMLRVLNTQQFGNLLDCARRIKHPPFDYQSTLK